MCDLSQAAAVKTQYATADRLSTRISIHSKYSTNKQGFGNWICSHYQIESGMRVLELGCGTGEMWLGKEELISRCSSLVLSDFSEGMLKKAKETLGEKKNVTYQVIDIQSIPYSDHFFDAVIANMMLYHVPNLEKGLSEVRRALKPDGAFYCATYGENGMIACVCDMFRDYGIQHQANKNFTLQNGDSILKQFFDSVQKYLYDDALAVTNVDDMTDYIFSLTGLSDLQKLPRETVRSVLEKNMADGVLWIPKEYGMFISK
ncbi:MAG: class I SAM-dependent methyltransferase [Clostridia bacterium]|nr:class I SAM-dependent methyltransferase [Clostridia bacterium]